MLKRIYIDNFKCLVDFELSLDSINLFLGESGSGRSAVFEVLQKLQAFICGDQDVSEIFQRSDCTRWRSNPTQTFELDIEGNEGIYRYKIIIKWNIGEIFPIILRRGSPYIQHEELRLDDELLLKTHFDKPEFAGNLQYVPGNQNNLIYDVLWLSESSNSLQTRKFQIIPGKYFPRESEEKPYTKYYKLLETFRKENQKIDRFINRIDRLIVVQLIPSLISDDGNAEIARRLMPRAENYASWYRYISKARNKVHDLKETLSEILESFSDLSFGKDDSLMLSFEDEKGKIDYRFSELSDGEKALIVLYTLIICTQGEDYTLCLDEPENFLSLPEIQPWLLQLDDFCGQGKLQALLISNHPESIDLLAPSIGYWFEQPSKRPIRVKDIQEEQNYELSLSELMARRWFND